MRSHTAATTPIARLAAGYGTLIDRFLAVVRDWVGEHPTQSDEENWFAMWYPVPASRIA